MAVIVSPEHLEAKLQEILQRVAVETELAKRAAEFEGARVLASRMVQDAPRDTGALAASIRVIEAVDGVAVGASVPYDRFVQKGTVYMDAQPYGMQAAAEGKEEIVAAVGAVIKAAIH